MNTGGINYVYPNKGYYVTIKKNEDNLYGTNIKWHPEYTVKCKKKNWKIYNICYFMCMEEWEKKIHTYLHGFAKEIREG